MDWTQSVPQPLGRIRVPVLRYARNPRGDKQTGTPERVLDLSVVSQSEHQTLIQMKTKKLCDTLSHPSYIKVNICKMTHFTKQRNAYIKGNRNQAVFTTGLKISVYSWDKNQCLQLGKNQPYLRSAYS